MALDEQISDLIKRIYCAGADGEKWDGVTRDVLRSVGAHAALTAVTDLKSGQLPSYRAYGPEDCKFALGMEEYSIRYEDDPSLAWACKNPRARFCASEDTLCPESYLQHDYVRWNYDRFGSTHWYVGYTPPVDDLSFAFSVHFPASSGRANPRSIRLFRMLFDHVECAVRLHRRPFNANSARALILLDAVGTVRHLTAGAERLLSDSGAVQVVGGRLQTAVLTEQRKLDAAIGRVLSLLATGSTPTAVSIEHAKGKRPWVLTMRPLIEQLGPFGEVACQLLVEMHEGLPRIGSLCIVQSLFDLTGRELEVVRLLADGHSLESLAECLGISVNTARTHLRSVFAKTETTRQSQLIQLCAGLQQP